MTTRPQTSVVEDSVEPLLEELLAEVVTGTRVEPKGHEREGITAALTEAAMVSFSRTVSQASAVERALLVEALAPALAEALAPALAKELAPEIVTALSHLATAADDEAATTYDESDESEDFYDDSGAADDESEPAGDESEPAGDESGSSRKAKRSREE